LLEDVSIFVSNNKRKIYRLFSIGRAVKPWLNDVEQLSWPELVGRKGTYAVKYIKEKTGKYIFSL